MFGWYYVYYFKFCSYDIQILKIRVLSFVIYIIDSEMFRVVVVGWIILGGGQGGGGGRMSMEFFNVKENRNGGSFLEVLEEKRVVFIVYIVFFLF